MAPPPYDPYFIRDSDEEGRFHELVTSFRDIQLSDRDLIVSVCQKLNNNDTIRIMGLEWFTGDLGPEGWRERIPKWSNREKDFVIKCLQWEYYMKRTLWQLCMEQENKKEEPKSDDAPADGDPDIGGDSPVDGSGSPVGNDS